MNRKSRFVFVLALVLMAGGLFATDGRMISLGYPYGFIRDDSDVHVYPATIFKYNRSVTGELYWYEEDDKDEDDYRSWCWTLGTNVPVGKSVFGAYLNMPVDALVSLTPPSGVPRYIGDLDLSRKQQFYFGFMDHFALGLGFAMSNYRNLHEYEDKIESSDEGNALYLELDGGMSAEKMDLGLKAHMYNAKLSHHVDDVSFEDYSASGLGLDLNGRYFLQETDALDIVATADLGFASGNWKQGGGSGEKTDPELGCTALMGGLGLGANYKVSANHHIILSLTPVRFLSQTCSQEITKSNDTEQNQSFIYIPEFTLGLESQVTKWLTGRIGAIQSYELYSWSQRQEYEDGAFNFYRESEYWPCFDMNCGLGFHFGKFNVDAVLSQKILHNGPSFIGGRSGGFASHISVNFRY